MTKQEQLLIKTVISNLEKSDFIAWTTRDLTQWSEFAKKMQATIRQNVPILKTLIHEDFQEHTPSAGDAAKIPSPSGVDMMHETAKLAQKHDPNKPWN